MSLSTQENTAINAGLLGGTFLTGTGAYVGKFASIESVGVSFGIAGITGASVTNISYLTGKSFAHPFSLDLPFTNISLTSGACYAKSAV